MRDREIELSLPPDQAMAALREAVEAWGGGWREEGDPEEFAVPTRAGIREGYARFRPVVEGTEGGSRLRLELLDQVLRVNRPAAMVLFFGAIGGLLTILWPLHDTLLTLAPVGAILALAAWLLVASRFRSYGPEELLATVAEIAEHEAPT